VLWRYLLIVGLFVGRAGSVLDPARTWFAGIGWKEEGPETDRRRQSVESVLGSSGAWVGSVGGERCRSCKCHRNLQKKVSEFAKSSLEYAKNSLDFASNSLKSAPKSLKFAGIWLDLAKSHPIWLRSRWISLDLNLILPELVGFIYNICRVGWLRFGRWKPAPRPASVGSWARRLETDRWER